MKTRLEDLQKQLTANTEQFIIQQEEREKNLQNIQKEYKELNTHDDKNTIDEHIKKLIDFAPQAAATTLAFSSVFILLLWYE